MNFKIRNSSYLVNLQITAPELAAKIDEVVDKLKKCRAGEMQFTFVLDDSGGNSFIENPSAPQGDPNLITTHYTRSKEQDEKLGIQSSAENGATDEQLEEGTVVDISNVSIKVLKSEMLI